jgi:hypothetical protein
VSGFITVETEDGTPVQLAVVGGIVGGGVVGDPPGAPTGRTADATIGGADLAWTAPADVGDSAITDYTVQSKPTAGSTWTTFAHSVSTATSISVTGLTGGTPYDFRVRAVNDQGAGDWSTVVSATPLAPGADYDEDFEGAGDLASRGFTVPSLSPVPTITAGNAVGTGAVGYDQPREVTRDFGSADGHWTWYVPDGHVLFPIVRFATDNTTFVQSYTFFGNFVRKVTFPGTNEDTPNLDALYPESGAFTIECVASGTTVTWYVNGVQAVQLTGAAYTTNTRAGMDLREAAHACSRFTYSASV